MTSFIIHIERDNKAMYLASCFPNSSWKISRQVKFKSSVTRIVVLSPKENTFRGFGTRTTDIFSRAFNDSNSPNNKRVLAWNEN